MASPALAGLLLFLLLPFVLAVGLSFTNFRFNRCPHAGLDGRITRECSPTPVFSKRC